MRNLAVGLASLVLVCLTVGELSAQELRKRFSKEFNSAMGKELYLNNKYGDIDVEQWAEDKVSIEVLVRVAQKRSKNNQRVLDLIEVKFSESGNTISAETSFRDDLRSDGELSIDYKVKIPSNIVGDFINKYGDINIDDISGSHFSGEVKYGNLVISRITANRADINVKYGGITLRGGEVENIDKKVKYGKINSYVKAKEASIESGYSHVAIANIDKLTLLSKYDKYSINNASEIDMTECGYTSLIISNLTGYLRCPVLRYGKLEMSALGKDALVDIEASYSPITIDMDDAFKGSLTLYTKYGDISLPSSIGCSVNNPGDNSKVANYSGGGNGSIKINNRYANIKLE